MSFRCRFGRIGGFKNFPILKKNISNRLLTYLYICFVFVRIICVHLYNNKIEKVKWQT